VIWIQGADCLENAYRLLATANILRLLVIKQWSQPCRVTFAVLEEGIELKKTYWVIVILVLLAGLDWYIQAPDSRSRELTRAIEAQASPKLKNYPYKFWVMKVNGATALVSTPRNFDVPAFKALAVLYPEIDTKSPNDPAFIAADQLLGEVQSEARAIVLAQPGIKDVSWELDRDWLKKHFIEVPEKR